MTHHHGVTGFQQVTSLSYFREFFHIFKLNLSYFLSIFFVSVMFVTEHMSHFDCGFTFINNHHKLNDNIEDNNNNKMKVTRVGR